MEYVVLMRGLPKVAGSRVIERWRRFKKKDAAEKFKEDIEYSYPYHAWSCDIVKVCDETVCD